MDYDQPQPRPQKSPAHSAAIRVRNRRREYLERHPEYFKSTEHELADPLLYDTLVRRFQTAEEREKEGRAKGYSRTLEIDLLRGEAKLSQLHESTDSRESASTKDDDIFKLRKSGPEDDDNGPPGSKEEGRERWNDFLRLRFVDGHDDDFNYQPIDEDDSYDALERREEEEAWFNKEDPQWVDDDGNEGSRKEVRLRGETGLQDF